MKNLRNPLDAKKYLKAHDYEDVLVPCQEKPRISFRDGSGDETWENDVAEINDWQRDERGDCCFESQNLDNNTRYCAQCGIGINKTVSYSRKDPDLKELERASAEAEIPSDLELIRA